MGWSDPDSFFTKLFAGGPIGITLSLFFTLGLPVLLHWYFYTSSPSVTTLTPTFLLVGPSGSGKTALICLLQQDQSSDKPETTHTRTSQEPSTVTLSLPPSIRLGSNKYRSENDYETRDAAKHSTRYLMIDTPGHGKLRSEAALSKLANPAVKGVIFTADSAALDPSDSEATRDTVQYLYDLLLVLQRRKTAKVKAKTEIPVLIAANKQDLFTALPAGAIKERLQTQLEQTRKSRSRGISSVDADPDAEDEDHILGGGGERPFSFQAMEEDYDIVVDVVGGAVRGEGDARKGVRKWEEWIGSCL